ncbi:hypothetical protein GCM10011410_14610 [Hoyosella rhizosphaerae]|uniref:Uncharacterized protein n=1 Tax=Hoyosella rhizosphaerae TaxID=1755582 RepID=A0A916U793_9ACTN|nr:hypothetical protein GCM10011410_14610 [Hoyosella rhizosphaerae]
MTSKIIPSAIMNILLFFASYLDGAVSRSLTLRTLIVTLHQWITHPDDVVNIATLVPR